MALLACVGSVGFTARAAAAPTPIAVVGIVYGNASTLSAPGSIVGTTANDNFASVSLDHGGSVLVRGTGPVIAGTALLSFSVDVGGPSFDALGNPVYVPILVSGNVSAFAPAGYIATATISTSAGLGVLHVCSSSKQCAAGLQAQSGTFELSARGGTEFGVTLTATMSGVTFSAPSEAVMAWADPTVQIDPSFANAALYHLSFSEGINAAPVPEASAAVLAGSGLALLTLAAVGSAKSR
jgi:hypothetical protein